MTDALLGFGKILLNASYKVPLKSTWTSMYGQRAPVPVPREDDKDPLCTYRYEKIEVAKKMD